MSRVYEPDAKWQDMADAGIVPQAANAHEYSVEPVKNAPDIK